MTLDEALFRYDNFINQLKKSLEFSAKFEWNANVFQSRMLEIFGKSTQGYCGQSYPNLLESMNEKLSFLQNNAFISSLDSFDRLSNATIPSLLNKIEISYELAERISNIVSSAGRYISKDIHEEYIETVPDISDEKRKTFLTFDRAIALLGLLIALYTAIISQLPSAQPAEVSQQNERLISIEEERLELERQRTELLEDIADNLRDIIVDFNEQIEAQTEQFDIFGNQPEDVNDLDISKNQDSIADCQKDNADSEY